MTPRWGPVTWGPVAAGPGRMRFRLWAPGQTAVRLVVSGREPVAMAAAGDGWFAAEVDAASGTRYRFLLGDGVEVPDPASRRQDGGVHGWSVVVDTAAAAAPDWLGRPWEEAVIQEVHLGLCGGFRGLAADLDRIAALGVTAIELMPVGAFSGTRGWGYDGVLPFAPFESYGTPDDLRSLIAQAHDLGLMVLLDVVYNHFGPDGNYIAAYAPDFFAADAVTPWGGAVAVDQPAVAAFFRENALMWLCDYGFDGLRFDAVHAIRNSGFLDRLAQDIRAQVPPGRHVHLILENEDNDAPRLADGLYDAQWNDDFHNVMHVLLTGETSAYYQDFAEHPAQRLARCLAEGFVYQGEGSPNHEGKPRGTPSAHLAPTAFVAFLQNHDQVGNRAMGERLTRLAGRGPLRAATALLLLMPQIPLLFMGDETGSRSPFLFFTDFHDELADIVRDGRRREFAKFAAYSDESARARIPDPNAAQTFALSRPERGPDAAECEDFYRTLLSLRAAHIVPRLRGARAVGAEALGDKAARAQWRMGDEALLTVAINLADDAVAVPPAPGTPIFATGEPGAGGSFAAWLAP